MDTRQFEYLRYFGVSWVLCLSTFIARHSLRSCLSLTNDRRSTRSKIWQTIQIIRPPFRRDLSEKLTFWFAIIFFFGSFSLIYSILNPQKAETGDLKLVGDKLRQCSTCSGTDFDGLARKVLEEKNYVSILISVLISFSNF